jgi:hypothetical protein
MKTDSLLPSNAWAAFCDTLKEAGQLVLAESAPAKPLDRAEGFRYLSRLARLALEACLENRDPLWPRLLEKPFGVTWGFTNPDQVIHSAVIGGAHDYRLWGTRGEAAYFSINAYSGSYARGGRAGGRAGHLDHHTLAVNPDGTFEVLLSRHERPDNWLRLTPDTDRVMVRQTFFDREEEQAGELHIERLGPEGPRPPVAPEQVAEGLARAAEYATGIARRFASWSAIFARRPNELHLLEDHLGSAARASAGADPNILAYLGYWRLAPDEALLVEARPPECDWWGFQLCNWWQESINLGTRRSHRNRRTVTYRPDGSFRLVIAHADPGVPNWIDPGGHAHGTMLLRWTHAAERVQPRTRVVKLAEVPAPFG